MGDAMGEEDFILKSKASLHWQATSRKLRRLGREAEEKEASHLLYKTTKKIDRQEENLLDF